MNNSHFMVDHVGLATDKPFEDVAKALEGQMGRFDPDVSKSLAGGGDTEEAQSQIRGDGGTERLHAVRLRPIMGRCCESLARSERQSSTLSATRCSPCK